MIFPNIRTERIVQVNDKTRLDASRSFANETDEITQVEISTDEGVTYVDVTGNDYLDWQFSSAGVVNIYVRINGTDTETTGLLVISEEEDNLFSNDSQLVEHEDDILNYVRSGRNSFIDKHRLAQQMILNELDKSGTWKKDNERYTADDITDIQEFSEWSKMLTLQLIFESLSNAIGDIYNDKANRYRGMATSAKDRACLRLDPDGDGETEIVSVFSGDLIRG